MDKKLIETSTGTTIVALILKKENKIIFATDTQSSMAEAGEWTYCGPKVTPIAKNMAIAGAGLAADSFMIHESLPSYIEYYQEVTEQFPTVDIVSKNLSYMMYSAGRQGAPYYTIQILGGFTDKNTPRIFTYDMLGNAEYLDSGFFAKGSGGRYALATIENGYREDLTEEEGINLAVNAIKVSKKYDLFSGLSTAICVLNLQNHKTFLITE